MQGLNNNQGSNTNRPPDPTSHIQPNLKGSQYENQSLSPEDLEDRWLRWKCLKCGFVYEGQVPVSVCPKCGNDDPDLFDDAD